MNRTRCKTWRRFRGQKEVRILLASPHFARHRLHNDHLCQGIRCVRDEDLAPIQDPPFIRLLRVCLRSPRIRTRIRLGQTKGRKPFARRQTRQPLGFLLLIPKVTDRPHPQRIARRHRRRMRTIDACNLFDRNHIRQIIRLRPTILLWNQKTKKPLFPHLSRQLNAKLFLGIKLNRTRLDLILRKTSDLLADLFLLRCQIKVHPKTSSCLRASLFSTHPLPACLP